ncbi:MAG TPA: phosphoserine aminotransferase, partial [Sphingobium sp.]|nr:phosphoserine aminotransferase [Sphingobium sp.]
MTDITAADATIAPATKPTTKPARPYFSSGPCAKPPGWSADKLSAESLGRSHRAKIGKTRLAYCIDLMRALLNLSDTHRIGIVPGSDTGAFE